MIFILILLLFLTKSEASLQLVFSDEFERIKFIDENKWELRNESCDGNRVNQLNCKTNNKNNLKIIDGTLALAAIRHKYSNKYFMSPLIKSRQMFSYGRFEIRAALPNAKMVRTAIELTPVSNTGKWPRDGLITLMSNTQTNELFQGIHYLNDSQNKYLGKASKVEANLNQFNVYAFEWNETEMVWIFNGKVLNRINIVKEVANNYNPFDKGFNLRINLGIGGNDGYQDYFPGQTLFEKDIKEWKCSILIIDYIRVYEEQEIPGPKVFVKETKLSSSHICSKIMPQIRPKESKWRLIFSDEFNSYAPVPDQDNWDIKHETEFCDGNHVQQLHCKTNSSRNVRISDNTLVLAAIQENHLNNTFTAPLITTKRGFKFGKFEIRAALPKGKQLRPSIYLEPINKSNSEVNNDLIEIMSNIQTQDLYFGIHFDNNGSDTYIGGPSVSSKIQNSFFNFHNYTLEWTETEFRWFLDDIHLFSINIPQTLPNNDNPFDKPFRLVLSLGVGGVFFKCQSLSELDAIQWPCSLFIIDYVRVYEETHEIIRSNTDMSAQNGITSYEICKSIMPLIRSKEYPLNITSKIINVKIIPMSQVINTRNSTNSSITSIYFLIIINMFLYFNCFKTLY